jgi:hypothetical protein
MAKPTPPNNPDETILEKLTDGTHVSPPLPSSSPL